MAHSILSAFYLHAIVTYRFYLRCSRHSYSSVRLLRIFLISLRSRRCCSKLGNVGRVLEPDSSSVSVSESSESVLVCDVLSRRKLAKTINVA